MEKEAPGKRICIFTNFTVADEAYSLNRVVQDQIKMFLRNGIKPIVVVSEGFNPVGVYKFADMRYIPNVPCHNEVKKDPTFESDVDVLTDAIVPILKEVDTVLTHDIVYKPSELKHNFAIRAALKRIDKTPRFLHWIHSATSPVKLSSLMGVFTDKYVELVREPFPNSYYVFFNDWSKPRIAKNFNVEENIVKTVYHPSDLAEVFGLDVDVEQFMLDYDMFSADAIGIYPCRLDDGKKVEMLIRTMACLKDFDMKVRTIVVDFHSTGGPKITYRNKLKETAIDYGLNQQELVFTSEYKPEWNYEVPHTKVLQMMRVANVLVMSSVSESFSKVTQEFALTGGVTVLNQNFPPFREIFGPKGIYRQYEADVNVLDVCDGVTTVNYGDGEKAHHKETARLVAFQLREHDSLATQIRLRKERNLDHIFKNYLAHLL